MQQLSSQLSSVQLITSFVSVCSITSSVSVQPLRIRRSVTSDAQTWPSMSSSRTILCLKGTRVLLISSALRTSLIQAISSFLIWSTFHDQPNASHRDRLPLSGLQTHTTQWLRLNRKPCSRMSCLR